MMASVGEPARAGALLIGVGQCGCNMLSEIGRIAGPGPQGIAVDSSPAGATALPATITPCFATDASGRGNNYALGYSGSGVLVEQALDVVRAQAEKLDALRAVVLMHSASGGTGSGTGHRLLEALQDCGKIDICSALATSVYVPDNALKPYNTVFALSGAMAAADVVLPFDSCGAGGPQSFGETNAAAVAALRRFVLGRLHAVVEHPARGWDLALTPPSPCPLRDLLASTSVQPGRNLVLTTHAEDDALAAVAAHQARARQWLKRTAPRAIGGVAQGDESAAPSAPARTATAVAMDDLARGRDAWLGAELAGSWPGGTDSREMVARLWSAVGDRPGATAASTATAGTGGGAGAAVTRAWSPAVRLDSYKHAAPGVVLAANSTSVVLPLRTVATRALDLLRRRAYLHHLERHGFEEDDVREALEGVFCSADSYLWAHGKQVHARAEAARFMSLSHRVRS